MLRMANTKEFRQEVPVHALQSCSCVFSKTANTVRQAKECLVGNCVVGRVVNVQVLVELQVECLTLRHVVWRRLKKWGESCLASPEILGNELAWKTASRTSGIYMYIYTHMCSCFFSFYCWSVTTICRFWRQCEECLLQMPYCLSVASTEVFGTVLCQCAKWQYRRALRPNGHHKCIFTRIR
jgi:hypothetical protein